MFHSKQMLSSSKTTRAGGARSAVTFAFLFGCAVVLAGCRYDMQDQPRYEIYESSDFFNNKLASRPLPEGTVARGYLRDDAHLYTGRVAGGGGSNAQSVATPSGNAQGEQVAERPNGIVAGELVTSPGAAAAEFDADLARTFPFPVTREVLDRGQERFQAYCSMCHGLTGDGDGMVVRRGFKKPTSYHDDRLRTAPVGHFFDVITNGFGVMPNYAAQVTPRDRWAIAAYIRALQLSRGARLEDVPEEERQQLLNAGSGEAQGQSEGAGGHSR
jgi:mono/diheme cytochrome c family protein